MLGGECEGQEDEEEQLICHLCSGVDKTLVFTPLVSLPIPQHQTIYCLSQKNNKSLNNSFLQHFGKESPELPHQIALIVILLATDPSLLNTSAPGNYPSRSQGG